MKSKIFKPTLIALSALFAIQTAGAQVTPPAPHKHHLSKDSTKVKDKDFQLYWDDFGKDFLNLKDLAKLKDIAPKIELQFRDFDKNFNFNLDNIAPEINLDLKDLGKLNFDLGKIAPEINFNMDNFGNSFNFNFDYNDKTIEKRIQNGEVKEKIKNYSKSYSLDANDLVKLSNQYGKITVNTWDKHEVKVDVQIKADANDDDEAQKLLDGVQIVDNKTGNAVSFKTVIEHTTNMYSWNGHKVHKVEINYTVYMPAKTDLAVSDSYGAIVLPDLSGKIKANVSYGSLSAQNLTNPANEIVGSYGSVRIASMSGGHLVCSYGSGDIGECDNIKASVSYGSFKLGSLKGTAEFDLSYVGGFKINEVASTFKKLSISSTYSGVSLGMGGNNNFNFDVTTSYGVFRYNDDKVTITDKTPADGNRHYSSTTTYKGYFGKNGTDAKVNINSNYGGVSFK
jgi:hypothetical protein